MIVKFTNTAAQRRKEKHLAWYRDFGRRVRAIRMASGTTEVDAAATCRMTLRAYRRWETGLPFRGCLYGLLLFAKKFDVHLGWLLAGEGSRLDHYEPEWPVKRLQGPHLSS